MEHVHGLSYKTVITIIHYPYYIVVLNKKLYVTTYHKIICFKYGLVKYRDLSIWSVIDCPRILLIFAKCTILQQMFRNFQNSLPLHTLSQLPDSTLTQILKLTPKSARRPDHLVHQ